MTRHLFLDRPEPVMATNIPGAAGSQVGVWLARGFAVDSTWTAAAGWTHRIVEVAR